MTGVGHTWIVDTEEGMITCAGCDCYKGSRASQMPCLSYLENAVRDHKDCPHCEPGEV